MRYIKILNLKLKNFKVHEELEVDFSQNKFVVISGSNGVGKSTIFDAIFWCLYDVTTKGLKGDKVVRIRSGKNTCVTLRLQEGDYIYEIINYRKDKENGNGKSLNKIHPDGTVEPLTGSSTKETNLLIENILMPADLFLNCLMFSQYAKTSFGELDHSKQRDILDRMLNLIVYDNYSEKISKVLKEKDNKLEEISKSTFQLQTTRDSLMSTMEFLKNKDIQIEYDFTQKKKFLEESILNTETFLQSNKTIKQDIDELHKKIKSDCDNRCNIQFNIQSIRTKTNDEILEVKSKLNNDEKIQILEIQKKYNKETKEQSLQLAKSNLESKKQEFQNRLQQIDSDLHKQKYELNKKYQEIFNPIDSNLQELKYKINNLGTEYKNIQDVINTNNSKIENIEISLASESPICFACGQSLMSEDAVSHLNNEINELKQINLDWTLKQNVIKVEGTNTKNLISEQEKLKEDKTNEYSTRLQSLQRVYETECGNLEEIRGDKLIKLGEEVSFIESDLNVLDVRLGKAITNLKEENRKKVEETEKEIRNKYQETQCKLENDLSNINQVIDDDSNTVHVLEQKYDELKNMFAKVKSDKEYIIQLEQDYHKNKEQLVKEHTDAFQKALKLDINIKSNNVLNDEIKKEIEILNFWKKGFSDTGIKSIIMDEAIPILNDRARELSRYTNLLQVSFDSQKAISTGELRNKFAVNALQTRNLSQGDQLSQGEERLVNLITLLCLRHLLEVMQDLKINILLFDEVLEHLDPTNTMLALEIIRKLSSDYHVILITHTLSDTIECDDFLKL